MTGILILAVGNKTSFLDNNKGSLSGMFDSTLSFISLKIKSPGSENYINIKIQQKLTTTTSVCASNHQQKSAVTSTHGTDKNF